MRRRTQRRRSNVGRRGAVPGSDRDTRSPRKAASGQPAVGRLAGGDDLGHGVDLDPGEGERQRRAVLGGRAEMGRSARRGPDRRPRSRRGSGAHRSGRSGGRPPSGRPRSPGPARRGARRWARSSQVLRPFERAGPVAGRIALLLARRAGRHLALRLRHQPPHRSAWARWCSRKGPSAPAAGRRCRSCHPPPGGRRRPRSPRASPRRASPA